MKKSIIYLGMALLSFSNLALAAEMENSAPKSTVSIYSNVTPLCMAISKGDVEVVKKFIEYGVSVNEQSKGMSPVMFAARYNNVEILKLLVEKGADISAKDKRGLTALKHAENSGAKEAAAYLQEQMKK